MPSYFVEAKDPNGNLVRTTMDMASIDAVVKELQRLSYTVIRVEKPQETFRNRIDQIFGIRHETVILFIRQMHAMLNSGFPLLGALSILLKEERNERFRKVLSRVDGMLRMGYSISSAFSHFPWVFSRIFVSLVKAGEVGGVLPEILERLAAYEEKELTLKKQVKAALTYPTFIIFTALLSLYVIFARIFPTFAALFKDLHVEVPFLTRLFLGAFTLATNPQFLLILFFTSVFLGISLKSFFLSRAGRARMDRLRLTAPIIGGVEKKVAMARFARTVGTLYQQGIPILTSVELAGECCNNVYFSERIIAPLLASLREGEGFSKVFQGNPLVPRMVSSMVTVGEHSGDLPEMLNRVADYYDTDIFYYLQGLASKIEPAVILLMGIFVAAALLSTYMPIYRLIMGIV